MLRPPRPTASPQDILGAEIPVEAFRASETDDVIWIARFAGGGLLSFEKADGTYVHTLNTESGLARRLGRFRTLVPRRSADVHLN